MITNEIISQRAPIHGSFDAVAQKAQAIKTLLKRPAGCDGFTNVQMEAIDLIATKLARICCGDPDHRDHWLDIAGYATLVLDRLPKEKT